MFLIGITVVQAPGPSNMAYSYRNYVLAITARSAMVIAINVFTSWYFGIRSSTNQRPAVIRYSNYLIILHSCILVGNMCSISERMETANFGNMSMFDSKLQICVDFFLHLPV